ncbi:MAG: HlyC/CorC family transporter [Chloroflexi bacterium]|nr:HlyC/CorC family transporter [Chloroflexota bacterium]
MDVVIPVTVITILILLNGIFVAAEFALIAAPPTRLAQESAAGSRLAAQVLAVLRDTDRQNRYLATAQIGITIVSLGLGMYGEHILADWLLIPLQHYTILAKPIAHTIASVLAVAALTYLHVVLGEMVAKSLALQFAEATALRLILPMTLMQRILSPVISLLNGLGNAATRLLGVPPAERVNRLFSPDELEIIVEESYAGGLIEPSQQLFIENIFDLKERSVGQVMTPRTRVVGISVDQSEEDVLQIVCETLHSRYPIYDSSLEQIIGMLHIKDLARYRVHREDDFDLRRFAQRRPVPFVPDTVPLDRMLARFRRERISLAVVVDEFGGTAGIVTLEDLVEEVVGEIQDEFDTEEIPFERIDERRMRVQGALLLDELNQHFDLKLQDAEVDTVGGLIMSRLGQMPVPGDQVTVDGILFVVESLEGRAVQNVCITLPEPAVDEAEDFVLDHGGEFTD